MPTPPATMTLSPTVTEPDMPVKSRDHAIAADAHIVGDLHKIVDLGILADHRVASAPRSIAEFAPISTSS